MTVHVPSDRRTGPVRTSAGLLVAITHGGLEVPPQGDDPGMPLALPELVLVGALATVDPAAPSEALAAAVAAGGDEAALSTVVAELGRRGLLCDEPRHGAGTVAVEPGAATGLDELGDDPERRYVLSVPTVLPVGTGGFEVFDHDGVRRELLSPVELHAAAAFHGGATVAAATGRHAGSAGALALDEAAVAALLDRLLRCGLVRPYDASDPNHNRHNRLAAEMRESMRRRKGVHAAFDRRVAAAAEAESDRPAGRTKVVPIETNWVSPPAGLGLIIAYAKAYDEGRLEDVYQFHPRWTWDAERLGEVADEPCVFLFSNYVWNWENNLALAALAKERNPASIMVHGGPNTPKYPADCEQYFADHPGVDITVRGEGEATFAELLAALDGDLSDLSVLADVPGLSYRDGDGVVHTGPRDRIADLDSIPSPYLTGLFDGFVENHSSWAAVVETNRGCPYGCTFCDWGSATLSRIRKFDLDRVFAELEWCARNKIKSLTLADANFGIFERDVAIAEKIAELKATYGYPQLVGTNYAKNTVKHLQRIIEVFAGAEILAEGIVSLQSMDPDTLLTIRRKNIKVEKYDDLSTEFRRQGLPLAVDLMMGLPGSTVDSLRNDLQECVNREVRTRVHPTQLLANSPMNDPAYRAEHGITASIGEFVTESDTFTREEWGWMLRLRNMFIVCDMFGVLRQVATYVRSETGLREIDVYERMLSRSLADRERWPVLAFTMESMGGIMAPPGSWHLLMAEVRDFVLEELGVADDAALATVLEVQTALLPAVGRTFPVELDLAHDYAAWHHEVQEVRDSGHRHDWHDLVPPLRTLPPARMKVDDPEGICVTGLGGSHESISIRFGGWELGSPVARARIERSDPVVVGAGIGGE